MCSIYCPHQKSNETKSNGRCQIQLCINETVCMQVVKVEWTVRRCEWHWQSIWWGTVQYFFTLTTSSGLSESNFIDRLRLRWHDNIHSIKTCIIKTCITCTSSTNLNKLQSLQNHYFVSCYGMWVIMGGRLARLSLKLGVTDLWIRDGQSNFPSKFSHLCQNVRALQYSRAARFLLLPPQSTFSDRSVTLVWDLDFSTRLTRWTCFLWWEVH